MKKWICAILLLAISLAGINVHAEYADVARDSVYADALYRVAALGMLDSYDDGTFRPYDRVTREQFAKAMVIAAGLEDSAKAFSGRNVFPDVEAGRWSGGYIGVAVNKGLITGMIDGKFHPEDGIAFSQACTLMVRALGYTDDTVLGIWPANYIEKASSLKLTKDISLQADEYLPRWAMALMMDRLLSTNMYKSDTTATDKTYAQSVGLFTECIILGDSRTMDKLTDKQVLTDQGIFYLPDDQARLNIGCKYQLILKGSAIQKIYEKPTSTVMFSVDNAVGTQVSYKSGGVTKTMVLPDKTTYYYQGSQQSYDTVSSLLTPYSSVILSYNEDKSGFEYGVIVDPVYSKPEVGYKYSPAEKKVGSIDLGNAAILRNTVDTNTITVITATSTTSTTKTNKTVLGETIDASKIKNTSVVYQVSDIWNENRYILVVDNKISGVITAILPNKAAPTSIEISGTSYTLSKWIPISKLNNSAGSYGIDSSVIALLGYDGKIVDFASSIGAANDSYAFVLNTSSIARVDEANVKTTTYSAKLLLTDGTTQQYDVMEGVYPDKYKGKLVKYQMSGSRITAMTAADYINPVEYVQQTVTKNVVVNNDDGTSTTTQVQQTESVPEYKKFIVNKNKGMINSNYAADDIKIYNVYSNLIGADAEVKLISFSSLPEGQLPEGKVLYIETAGVFQDVSMLVLDDVFDEKTQYGVIYQNTGKNATSSGVTNDFSLKVGTKEYSLSGYGNLSIGSVMVVKVESGSIKSISQRSANAAGNVVEAVDAKRIRMNGMTYKFSSDLAIYYVDVNSEITLKAISDIEVGRYYSKIEVYLDRAGEDGSLVKTIVLFGPTSATSSAQN